MITMQIYYKILLLFTLGLMGFNVFAENVMVVFDPNGGACLEKERIVQVGKSYCERTVYNLYPSGSRNNFSQLGGTLNDNIFVMTNDNSKGLGKTWCNFYSKPVPLALSEGARYTYVLEILSIDGGPVQFQTGNTGPGTISQLSRDMKVINKPGVYFFKKTAQDISQEKNPQKTYLDRGFFLLEKGQKSMVKFRVSLFEGNSISAENFSYVIPGAGIAVTNRVPTASRFGYVFDGWYDPYGNKVTDNSIVNNKNIRLTAYWKVPIAKRLAWWIIVFGCCTVFAIIVFDGFKNGLTSHT